MNSLGLVLVACVFFMLTAGVVMFTQSRTLHDQKGFTPPQNAYLHEQRMFELSKLARANKSVFGGWFEIAVLNNGNFKLKPLFAIYYLFFVAFGLGALSSTVRIIQSGSQLLEELNLLSTYVTFALPPLFLVILTVGIVISVKSYRTWKRELALNPRY